MQPEKEEKKFYHASNQEIQIGDFVEIKFDFYNKKISKDLALSQTFGGIVKGDYTMRGKINKKNGIYYFHI